VDRSGGRVPLDRARIVAAAVALADAEGLAALSMRNLAGRLGCGTMSLYNHVAGKDELHTAMVEAVAAEVVDPPAGLAPLPAVRALALATREVFLAHPWAPGLWLRHLPGPVRAHSMELLLRLLADSGLSAAVAHHGFHAVNNHVLGYTLQELEMTMGGDDPAAAIDRFLGSLDPVGHAHVIAHVHQHVDGHTDSSFGLVLDLILDGLVRLDRGDRPDGAQAGSSVAGNHEASTTSGRPS
jgi:AcrR family transcriptional regulator